MRLLFLFFNLGNIFYLKIVSFFWKLHLVEHVFFLGMVFLREALFDLRKAWSGLKLQLGSLFFC